jgi:hypothetical protein
MTAQKFQLRYSAAEDRILVAVTNAADDEHVFALTRRLLGRLLPGLRKILGELPPPAPVDPPQEPAPVPEASAEPATGPAATPDTAPAGPSAGANPAEAAPRLVTRVRISQRPYGAHVLHLSDAATTLNMPLNTEQLGQFTAGIMTMLDSADWNLDLSEAADEEPDAEAPRIDISADSPSRYRH